MKVMKFTEVLMDELCIVVAEDLSLFGKLIFCVHTVYTSVNLLPLYLYINTTLRHKILVTQYMKGVKVHRTVLQHGPCKHCTDNSGMADETITSSYVLFCTC